MDGQQTNLFEARRARDDGLKRTTRKNTEWLEAGLKMLPRMAMEHREASGEEMRIWLLANGLAAPTSPHAWGALTRTAVTRGLIKDTHRVKQMWTEKSHARRTPVWEIVHAEVGG